MKRSKSQPDPYGRLIFETTIKMLGIYIGSGLPLRDYKLVLDRLEWRLLSSSKFEVDPLLQNALKDVWQSEK